MGRTTSFVIRLTRWIIERTSAHTLIRPIPAVASVGDAMKTCTACGTSPRPSERGDLLDESLRRVMQRRCSASEPTRAAVRRVFRGAHAEKVAAFLAANRSQSQGWNVGRDE